MDEALREEIAQTVAEAGGGYWARADAVLALPAVRQLLADAAAAQRVRASHVPVECPSGDYCENRECEEYWPCTTIRALDGTGRPARAESGSQGDSGRSAGQGGVR